ncbi:MAG: PPOX class F420-dependent oxidoreductase [Nitriliruptoraceae bacterium]
MRPMSDEERRSFLAAGAPTAALATTRADGRPHVAPIWFLPDGDDLVFTTWHASVKGRNLARDPRAAISVDDPAFPFSFVAIEGTCALSDDLDQLGVWARRIAARYVPADRAEEYGRRNAVAGELLVRLSPTRITTGRGVAD